jgi:protein-tyrosine phosphatase
MKRTWENYTRICMYSENQINYLQTVRSLTKISVHLVCLGNICRSPMANAVLIGKCSDIQEPKIEFDSSGTGPWHVGEGASEYSIKVWQQAGYKYQHVAKQFKESFFKQHDLILAMDLKNRSTLLKLAKTEEDKNKVLMFLSFDPQNLGINPDGEESHKLSLPDPYGMELTEYKKVMGMVERAADGFKSWVNS